MEILGYFLAGIMGLILGLLGGGGSILTVPILVYFFGIPAVLATGYSLFVVGFTSLLGAFKYFKDKLIDFKIAFLFAGPSVVGVLLARTWLLPAVPDQIELFSWSLSKDQLIMAAFAFLVLIISLFMLKAREKESNDHGSDNSNKSHYFLIGLEGLFVGVVTGFVGAGGGFMIVPALVILARVPLRKAIATSLVIISLKSIAGFLGDLSEGVVFDWAFLLGFVLVTTVGVVLGTILNKKIPVAALRKGFAFFVFVMGLFIVYKELF